MSARKPLKRLEVERRLHKPSGVELSVCYDNSKKVFFANVADERVEAKTQVDCMALAVERANILLSSEAEWKRVIFLEVEDYDGSSQFGRVSLQHTINSPKLAFDAIRLWVRDTPSGRMTRSWDREPVRPYERTCQEQQADVEALRVGLNGPELPYTDETWEALKELGRKIDEMRLVFDRLSRSADFVARLSAGASNLLAAPATTGEGAEDA